MRQIHIKEIKILINVFCSFQKLLITLLNADRTYLKMAKDMVYGNLIGPILELLDNMLHNQIVSYTRYKINFTFIFFTSI